MKSEMIEMTEEYEENTVVLARAVALTRADLEQLAGLFISLGVKLGAKETDAVQVRSAAHLILDETFGSEK